MYRLWRSRQTDTEMIDVPERRMGSAKLGGVYTAAGTDARFFVDEVREVRG